jgi:hypothetical protein
MPWQWTYYAPLFAHTPPTGAAWGGHRRFGYDLVRNRRPRTLVELGSSLGTSFFSFCQAAKDAKLPTTLWAVDTWRGDQHTGTFDDSFKARFDAGLALFPTVDARPLVETFDQARPRFAAGTIDILHIDGCHTYEAARHDYDHWIEAVAPDGVVLFHDTAHRDGGFGVYRLWDELTATRPGVSFRHSHGLGVLFGATPERDLGTIQEDWRRHYDD